MIIKNTIMTIAELINDMHEGNLVPAAYGNRMTGQMLENKKYAAGIIATIIHDWYILPGIVCEGEVIDGNNRLKTFDSFKNENFRLPAKFDNQIVEYEEKQKDENGKFIRGEDGRIVTETKVYNLGGHTYDELPKELQYAFNHFNFGFVQIILDEEEKKIKADIINKMMKMYNQNISFNTNQVAFTHINNFAEVIREDVMMADLFKAEFIYSKKDVMKGCMERIICDTVMLINFPDSWKKNASVEFDFVNDNADVDMFYEVTDLANELTECVDDKVIKSICSKADLPSWLCAFKEFKNLGFENDKFAEFMNGWLDNYSKTIIDGMDYAAVCGDKRSGRDTVNVRRKAKYITTAMKVFLGLAEADAEVNEEVIEAIAENVTKKVVEEITKEIVEANLVEEVTDNVTEEVVEENTNTEETIEETAVVETEMVEEEVVAENATTETAINEVVEDVVLDFEAEDDIETEIEAENNETKTDKSNVLFKSEYIEDVIKTKIPFLRDIECTHEEFDSISNQLMALYKGVEMYKLRGVNVDEDAFEVREMVDVFNKVYDSVADMEVYFEAIDAPGLVMIGKTINDFVCDNNVDEDSAIYVAEKVVENIIDAGANISGTYEQRSKAINGKLADELNKLIAA